MWIWDPSLQASFTHELYAYGPGLIARLLGVVVELEDVSAYGVSKVIAYMKNRVCQVWLLSIKIATIVQYLHFKVQLAAR